MMPSFLQPGFSRADAAAYGEPDMPRHDAENAVYHHCYCRWLPRFTAAPSMIRRRFFAIE